VSRESVGGANRWGPWAPAAVIGGGALKLPDRVLFRETPESSELQGVMYLARRKRLWVYFRSGAMHVYFGVDAAAWEALQSAESKEQFVLGLPSPALVVKKKKV